MTDYIQQRSNTTVRMFPAGEDFSVYATLLKPKLWRKGTSRLSLVWLTDGTDVNNVQILIEVSTVTEDGLTSGLTYLKQSTVNLTPSGTSNQLASYELDLDTNDIDDDAHLIDVHIKRNGATDSNPDDFYIGPVVIEFLQRNRQ